MESKESFIEDYSRRDLSFSDLCRRHQISRSVGYKWLRRYEDKGLSGLNEISRKPKHSPRTSSARIEAEVLAIRKEHPVWGGRKIRRVMENEGIAGPLPAPSTISNILRRHGLLGKGTRGGAKDIQRFERDRPNDLWQMDFKGWIMLDNGKRCYPLTVLDDHSRYNIVLEACPGEQDRVVRKPLIKAFRRFGLPRQILCDHGNPWGKGMGIDGRQQGTTAFELWLMRLGVETIHGRVRHPQTQGKEERFHRSLKAEVLDRQCCWRDLSHCQNAFDRWQRVYNQKRPHEALDMQTPCARYKLSHRTFPEVLEPVESFYLQEDQIRRVKSKGEITFKNHFFYTDQWDVFYCWKRLGSINLTKTSKAKGRYHSIKDNV